MFNIDSFRMVSAEFVASSILSFLAASSMACSGANDAGPMTEVSTSAVTTEDISSLPGSFTCFPRRFYSGGFNFYHVESVEGGNEAFALGETYWQNTTPHGIIQGEP